MIDKILEIVKMIIGWLCKKQDVTIAEEQTKTESLRSVRAEAHARIMREIEEVQMDLLSLNRIISAKMVRGENVAIEFNRRRDMLDKQQRLQKELDNEK